jgi:hypothetical protein
LLRENLIRIWIIIPVMINPQTANEIQQKLVFIESRAAEIEMVPTFGVDVWTMNDIHKKCEDIRANCKRISVLVGTGSGGTGTGTGTGSGT